MSSGEGSTEVKLRDKPVQCRHWVRPRSSLYSYLYDYQRNYYDDVINYLDLRRKGVNCDIPRPQTWAERALRTYTQRLGEPEHAMKARYDPILISKVHRSRVFYDIYSRDYNARRFTMLVS